MSRYAIWNKKDNIITPSGAVFTAQQWIEKYPVAGIDTITVLCSAGEINGGFFGTLGSVQEQYAARGCDFTGCVTPEEKLACIDAFDERQRVIQAEKAAEAAASAQAAKAAEASLAEREVTALEAIASGQTTENTAALDALLMGEV